MAHFAEIDDSGIVQRVLVVDDKDTADADGNEVESIGAAYLKGGWGGTWLQTSYNNNIRKRFAGRLMQYREDLDAFITIKPYESWVLDEETCDWVAPIPKPEDDGKFYTWKEDEGKWLEVEPVEVEGEWLGVKPLTE